MIIPQFFIENRKGHIIDAFLDRYSYDEDAVVVTLDEVVDEDD